MKKLLSSPVKMPLSEAENNVYQNALKHITPLGLNLMAVKVEHHPDDFLGWCRELIRLCREDLNMELLDNDQLLPLKKLQDVLELGCSISQFKMLRIAPWPIFVDFIEQQSDLHAVDERLRLLIYVEQIRQKPLAELLPEDRLTYAGKHTSQHDYSVYNFDSEWFASTKGAKVFHILFEQSPELFDAALAHIPLTGDVTDKQYQAFVKDFKKIFQSYTQVKSEGEAAPLAAATRLLAMRRPDQFIALNNNKIDVICQGLAIVKFNNKDFDAYWYELIGTLRTCAWWHQQAPEHINEDTNIVDEVNAIEEKEVDSFNGNRELIIWQNRAILVDIFLFADETLAQSSNYIRLRDKAQNKVTTKSKTVLKKRSKESAEMLVDKALSAEDIPAYLFEKRSSIINQVKDGKTVEQAIGLIRAIFG